MRNVLIALVVLAGCTDLGEYRGSFRGGIVGTDDEGCDTPPCSFIRRGFAAGTTLTLDLDPAALERGSGSPGEVSTSDGRFDHTPLELIGPLEHDQLSRYDFPGGRKRNFIVFSRTVDESPARPSRDVMMFVSLMSDEAIEVRVIAGPGDESRGDLFGLFALQRQR